MVKKAVSFAQKARKKGQKDYKYVQYVKSVKSEKTGHWRFKETMVRVNSGETLAAALERTEKEALALHDDMEVIHPEMVKMVTPEPDQTSAVEVHEESEEESTPVETQLAEEVPETTDVADS